MATFKGPRFGRYAQPDRDGQTVTLASCECLTCRDMGAWLAGDRYAVTVSYIEWADDTH